MSLVDFFAKSKACEVKIVGGVKVILTFRPYCLADAAWLQHEFEADEIKETDNLDIGTLCKIIWNQLTPECKQIFADIVYEDYDDETGETVNVVPSGHEKLMHSLQNPSALNTAYRAFIELQDINSFVKKKAKRKAKVKKTV